MTTNAVGSSGSPAPEKPVKKRAGIGRWIFRILGTLVVLIVLLLVGLYVFRNTLVKMGVERGGKYATLQETLLDSADLSLGSGTLELNSLGMGNPTPYKESHFLTVKTCKVAVDSGSLLTNDIHVKEIAIGGLEIWLEQSGVKSNLGEILDILNKQTGSTSAPAAGGGGGGSAPTNTAKAAPGKSLKIDAIKLIGSKVHVRGLVTLDLDLGDIEIKDPTNPDGRPMKIANVIGTVLVHVAMQIAKNPQLPAVFKDSLKNVDQLVSSISKAIPKDLKLPGDLGKNFQNLTSQPTKALEGFGKGFKLPGQ